MKPGPTCFLFIFMSRWPTYSTYYTVSRAKTIYHAIAGSGAKISVNFMDAGLFFHVVFPILYMGIFHLLCCVHGNIPRSFQWLHEQFPWKYFYGYGYKYCNLGVTGSNPKQNKNNLQGKKIQCTLQVSPIQKVEAQTNI
jgi:hypothetical protein